MRDKTMGNQQRNLDFAIGYLVGMIDGEGTITISKSGKTKTPPLYTKLQPTIFIVNTDKAIIDTTVRCIKQLGLPFHIYESKRVIKHKPVFRITACGHKRVTRWIKILKNVEFGKKEKLSLLEEFINSRNKTIDSHPFRKPYNKREIEILNEIRISNERGGKSRYIFTEISPDASSVENRIYKFEKMIELVNKGWKQKKIANYFGIDQSSVSKWIKRNKKFINAQRLPSGLRK